MVQAKELVKSGQTALLDPDLESSASIPLDADNGADPLEFELDASDPEAFDEEEGDEESLEEEDEAIAAKGHARRRSASKKKLYTDDSVRVYLQEIGRIRLLRPDEEIELARKIADLLELERAREAVFERMGLWSSPEEVPETLWAEEVKMSLPEFRRRLHQGRRAKEKMVQSNLRLVVSIAKKYMNRGLSFQDLIQEGSLGLIRAAEKFDHEKGYKFSTYATWWIRQHAMRYVHTARRAIRLPVHQEEAIGKIRAIETRLAQELKREPTADEIANALGPDWTASKVEELKGFAQEVWSLEEPVYRGEGEEDGDPYGSFLESRLPGPDGVLDQVVLRQGVERALKVLTEREEQVIRLRFGLDTERPLTLEEVAKLLGVTRERVRQIEAKALRRLRYNPASQRILRGLLNEE